MIVPNKACKKHGLNYDKPYMADEILQEAKMYYNATMILEAQRNNNALFPPIIMNASFACELFSKAILYKEGTNLPIKEHGLKKLYDNFSDDVRTKMMQLYKSGTEGRFETWIDDIDEIFEFWRYRFEHEKYSTHYDFVLDYMKILKIVTEQLVVNAL